MTIPVPVVQVWDATGATALGTLRAVSSLTISDQFCDVGSLEIHVPKNVIGASALLADEDRQVRVIQAGCPDMWFLADDDSFAAISDDPLTEDSQVTLRSLAGVFDEAKVAPFDGFGATDPSYAFVDATPGEIVTVLAAAAQGRGLIEGITILGDAVNDASGTPWPDVFTRTYSVGASILDVLKGLAADQVLEWRMNARVLELHRPGGDLDRLLTIALRPGRDITSAPYLRSKRSIATSVIVQGQSGATVRRTQALAGRRAREAFSQQSSAPDDALEQVGDLHMGAHAAPDVQITPDLTDDSDTPVPWSEDGNGYRCGDRIPTLVGVQVAAQRVAQIARTYDDSGNKVTLELGSVLKSAEELFDDKLRKLLAGYSDA